MNWLFSIFVNSLYFYFGIRENSPIFLNNFFACKRRDLQEIKNFENEKRNAKTKGRLGKEDIFLNLRNQNKSSKTLLAKYLEKHHRTMFASTLNASTFVRDSKSAYSIKSPYSFCEVLNFTYASNSYLL